MTILEAAANAGDRVGAVVTIGSFDGVHRGHQLLLARTRERAAALGVESVVITFEPLPAMVLRPDRFLGRVCTAQEKLELLQASGIDQVRVLTFDTSLSRLTPEDFLTLLEQEFAIRELWVGEAFVLGKDRVGNVERLQAIGGSRGYDVHAMPRVVNDADVISSSGVRHAILIGDVDMASRLLGRQFEVTGEVIHGAHFGRTIGYPTANIEPPAELVPLADGIYASLCRIGTETRWRWGMTYIGTRPTVNSGPRQIETNLLDFEGDLYGRLLRIAPVARLRPDENFPTLDGMITQLGEDERATRAFLAKRDPASH